jgi:hypothetical protein
VVPHASVPQSAEGMRRERIQWAFEPPQTHQLLFRIRQFLLRDASGEAVRLSSG